MGVVELPDGEPQACRYSTVGEYAKAYIDWAVARHFTEQLANFERRLTAIEKPKGAER